ncbi:MAG: DUF4070 domain-containing protein [Dehalococcoidales bacterium]|nr:DUF4070 domain-containing protein [Dehalococcoidales bacterium]
MRILMVYPQYPDTFWSFKYALSLFSKKAVYPPLGLLTVAAMLPSDWEKKLIDMNVTRLNNDDILWADYVFVSAMHVQSQSVKEVISRCGNLDRKVVAGGPLFTIDRSEYNGVSYFVLGEVENIMPAFISDLTKGEAKPIYQSNEKPELINTPLPLWSLLNMKDYSSMNLQYSRGCPFDCEFCDIVALFGHKPRTKSSQQMVNELQALYDAHWRGQVFIVDDNLIGNKIKLKREVLPAIIEWSKSKNYPFYFVTEASMDLADDEELMNLMADAGIYQIFVGIESPNESSLVECNKIPNKHRDLIASVKKIQNHGFEVIGGFIIGFDNDTPAIFENQIDFIQKSGIVCAMVGIMMALPGTKLYERLKAENRLLHETSGNNTESTTNFISKMGNEVLANGYKHVIDKIYSADCYYRRIKTFYKEFHPKTKGSSKVELNYIISLIKSIWILGVVENGKKYFWTLLVFTLYKYPQLFWKSMSFAINRRHYYRHARKILKA